MSDINFAAVREAATAAMEGVQTPATSVTEAPPADAVVPDPTVAEAAAVAEAKKWKLKDPEGEFEADENELVNGHLRFRDYTRKTQAVSTERKAVEAERKALADRESRINELLSNEENVAQYYEFLSGKKLTPAQQARVEEGKTPTPSGNPNEVATLEEAQKIAKAQADQVQQRVEQQLLENLAKTQRMTQEQTQSLIAEAQMRASAANFQTEISSHVTALAKDMPLLAEAFDLQELEDQLCKDVMKLDPKSIDEAKKLLIDAAKDRNARLERIVTAQQKTAAVAKATLTEQGIEPKGGSLPGTPAVTHKLGDKKLTAGAIAFMESYKK